MALADLIQLMPTVVAAALPLLISLSGVLYKRLVQYLPEQRRATIEQVVNTVVAAIEQAATSTMQNADKKQAAILLAQRTLRELGLKVSPDTIAIMIESSVYAMKQSQMTLPAIPSYTPEAAPMPNMSFPYCPTYCQNYVPAYQPMYTQQA